MGRAEDPKKEILTKFERIYDGLALLIHPCGRNSSETRVLTTKGRGHFGQQGVAIINLILKLPFRPQDQTPVKPPRVLIPPDFWDEFRSHLLDRDFFLWFIKMIFTRWVAGPC